MNIKILLSFLALCITTSLHAYDNGKDCSHNCFSTEINSVSATEDGCYNYSLTVSYNGDCTYALSHFTVDSSCGIITALTNSENWKQEIGKADPTTNLTGFKIDDIKDFGEKAGSGSFTVNFTICPQDTECAEALRSWSPVVAYKAGQCVYYETINNSHSGGGDTDEGDDDDPDDGSDDDGSDDDASDDDGSEGSSTGITGSLTPVSPTCADSNDGQITLDVTGGEGPYQYLWSTGATTQNITGLSAGTYSVAITDANGDALNLSTVVSAPEALSVNYEISNSSCGSTNDGAITIIASGGSGSYTYQWSNGSTATSLSGLPPGNYEVTVQDGAGCTYSQIFSVGAVSEITVSAIVNKSSCGQNDGSLDVSVSGGSGDYTYSWLDGATTEDRQNLSAGYYTVTVTDAGGCTSTRTFSVRENNTINVSGSVVPTGCPDDNTGGVNLSVSGTTGNIYYLWSTGATTANLTGVGKGRYEVVVTDDSGCSVTKSFYVFGETLAIQSDVQHPKCAGDTDGSITLTSAENITVSWSNGATTASLTGLAEGVYTATVSNESGCSSTFSYYIDAPEAISFSTEITNPTCDPSGYAANIITSGGTPVYQVTWADGYEGASREALNEGTYFVTITDENGCQATGDIIVDATLTNCTENTDPAGDEPTGDESTGDDGTGDDGTGDDGTGDDGTGDDGTGDDGTGDDGSGDDSTSDDGTGDDSDGTGDNTTGDDGSSGEDTDDGTGDDATGDDGTGDDSDNDGTGDGSGDDGTGDDGSDDDGSDDDGTGEDGSGDEGSGDEGSGDGTETDKDCGDPYHVEITLSETGDCLTYTGKIIYSGDKTYGLSHAVISPSCGSIDGTYTEIGQFENGVDPTSGLNGLKIDEISRFGEGNTADQLEFSFELCNSECENSETVSFVVSYKFGQCITYDTIYATLPQGRTMVSAYPNPAAETIKFNVENKTNDVSISLYNMMGILMKEKNFSAGEQLQLDVYDLPDDFYMYRLQMGSDVKTGKILVSHN